VTGSVPAITIVCNRKTRREAEVFAHGVQSAGITTKIVNRQLERGIVEVALILLFAIPARTFLEALGTSLGDSAGVAAKNLIRKAIGDDGEPPNSYIILRDTTQGIDFELKEDLPVEAYEQLMSITSVQAGVLHYDRTAGKWVALDPAREED
jgi:hypothetical protein